MNNQQISKSKKRQRLSFILLRILYNQSKPRNCVFFVSVKLVMYDLTLSFFKMTHTWCLEFLTSLTSRAADCNLSNDHFVERKILHKTFGILSNTQYYFTRVKFRPCSIVFWANTLSSLLHVDIVAPFLIFSDDALKISFLMIRYCGALVPVVACQSARQPYSELLNLLN